MIYLGADTKAHKQILFVIEWLEKNMMKYKQLGAKDEVKAVDITDFVRDLTLKVAEDFGNRGIMMCGTGLRYLKEPLCIY
ncbi:MAG: RpiB/LacA/LacB family sugar-phosphate isomerase [Patescibacteria group bacterium]|nr:RpiB/LacA/LacB family sugar-phosphate isomerase [Patescibacteria group bacterium]